MNANRSLISLFLVIWTTTSPIGWSQVTLDLQSREERYDYASNALQAVVLNPILFSVSPFVTLPVGLVEAWETGCGRVRIWGLDVAVSDGGGSPFGDFRFRTAMVKSAGLSANWAQNGVTINGAVRSFIPTVEPCGPTSVLTHFGGSTSLYVVHAGTAGYKKLITFGTFTLNRQVVVENSSTEQIELPVHIGGSAVAGSSLADDPPYTYGLGRLKVSGTVGGVAINHMIEANSANGFPHTQDINVTQRVVVAPGSGRVTVPIAVTGELRVEVSAKGIGLFGLITQSATAEVSAPNSINIGPFSGPNGGPLPPGVLIYADDNPADVLVDTRPNLALKGWISSTTTRVRTYGPAGRTFRLMGSPTLSSWVPLQTTTSTSQVVNFDDPQASLRGDRYFYRVEIE